MAKLLDFDPIPGEHVRKDLWLIRVITDGNTEAHSSRPTTDCYTLEATFDEGTGEFDREDGISMTATSLDRQLTQREIAEATGIPRRYIKGYDRIRVSDIVGRVLTGSDPLSAVYSPTPRNPYHVTLFGMPDPIEEADNADEAAMDLIAIPEREEIRYS